jgi:hypothetical protein
MVCDTLTHLNFGTFVGSYTTRVPKHGVVMLRVKP